MGYECLYALLSECLRRIYLNQYLHKPPEEEFHIKIEAKIASVIQKGPLEISMRRVDYLQLLTTIRYKNFPKEKLKTFDQGEDWYNNFGARKFFVAHFVCYFNIDYISVTLKVLTSKAEVFGLKNLMHSAQSDIKTLFAKLC